MKMWFDAGKMKSPWFLTAPGASYQSLCEEYVLGAKPLSLAEHNRTAIDLNLRVLARYC
jgi:hypothetical protein